MIPGFATTKVGLAEIVRVPSEIVRVPSEVWRLSPEMVQELSLNGQQFSKLSHFHRVQCPFAGSVDPFSGNSLVISVGPYGTSGAARRTSGSSPIVSAGVCTSSPPLYCVLPMPCVVSADAGRLADGSRTVAASRCGVSVAARRGSLLACEDAATRTDSADTGCGREPHSRCS